MAEQEKTTSLEYTEEVTSEDEHITSNECNESEHQDGEDLSENTIDFARTGAIYSAQGPSCSSSGVAETLSVLPLWAAALSPNTMPGSGGDGILKSDPFAEALKCRYRKTKIITPLILDNDPGPGDSEQDNFVDLKIEERDPLGLPSDHKDVTPEELFHTECKEGIRRKRTILITGDAGFGKTVLTRKICCDWATLEDDNYLSCFDLVFNIPLRNIASLSVMAAALIEMSSSTNYEKPNVSLLQERNTLYILDGIDETTETSQVISFLEEHANRLQSSSAKGNWTVIVTSRPHAVEKLETSRLLFDRRLSVSGFSTDNHKKYIHTMLGNDKAQCLTKRIENDIFLRTASNCPLVLHLICCVHRKVDISNVSCRTELYLQILKLMIETNGEKYGRNRIHEKFQELSSIKEDQLFIRLGYVASKYLLNEEHITKESLVELFEKEEFEFVIGLGILVAVHTLSDMKPKTTYEFLHLTFAEFTTAIYAADAAVRSELTIDGNFAEVLDLEFFAGVLGKRIVNTDIALSWIGGLGIRLPRLHDIKNEARLEGELWESFCSHIKRVSFDCLFSNIEPLPYTTLPNLREIIITYVSPVSIEKTITLLWDACKLFVYKFSSCECLKIAMALDVIYLHSEEVNKGFRFIPMEGKMTKLIELENFARSVAPKCSIYVQILPRNVRRFDTSDCPNKARSLLEKFKIRGNPPIGLLPSVLPSSASPYGHWLYYIWKTDKMEIRYVIETEDKSVRKLSVPIIAVTPKEYEIIGHDGALKVEGFKSSPMTDSTTELEVPKTFGYVDSSTFLERLKEFEIETPLSYNTEENDNNSFSFFFLRKKFHGVIGSTLEAVFDSSNFSYLNRNFYSINERMLPTSVSEGFSIVETSYFTRPKNNKKDNTCVTA